jgi:RHS repeat-associated protein
MNRPPVLCVLNRLLTVTEPGGKVTSYTYDAAGNRLTQTVVLGDDTTVTTYTYDSQNRLTGATITINETRTKDIAYVYDNNGNELTQTETSYVDGVPQTPVDVLTNTYDVFNQLITTATSGGTTVTNVYNGDGLRVEKIVNDVSTRYLYEYNKVVLELNSDGDQTARNVYGINLISRTVGEDTFNYMYNGHADVTALLDADGDVIATYYYDAFGNITEHTGNQSSNILYAGYQYDPETGLYYLNARMYDPVTARFMQEDTYRGDNNDPLSLNLYTYCHNEPLMYSDPSGHFSIRDTWNNLKVNASNLLSNVDNAVSSAYHKVVDGIDNFASNVYQKFTNGFGSFLETFKDFGSVIKDTLSKDFSNAKNWVNNNKGAIVAGAVTGALILGGIALTVITGGAAAVVIGSGMIGAGIAIGGAAYKDYKDDSQVNNSIGDYVKTGLAGAAFGAIASAAAVAGVAVFGAGSAGSLITSMAGASAGDAVYQDITKGSVDYKEAAMAGLTTGILGMAFSAESSELGEFASEQTSKISSEASGFKGFFANETGSADLSGLLRNKGGAVDEEAVSEALKAGAKIDYKEVFFEQNPELRGEVVVHHGVEQQVLRRPETDGLFTEEEIHSYDNLRGISKDVNSDVHLSKIRNEWNNFYRENLNPTKEQILQKRTDIDQKFGDLFNPPIKK